MQFREHRSDNGLQIVAECNASAHSMALGFFVNTGARDESDDISGVSHFLEHMTFKGTPTRSAADVNRELDEIGSHANAFTSEEQTVYYAAVLPEYQDQVLDILSDIMRPSLRSEDFELEKQVILEEIAKYEDQPPFGATEKCMAAHFQTHPLGRNILGTAESVGSLTPEQMRSYFDQRYSPGNIVLVAAGNTDFDRLVDETAKRCASWHPFEVGRETPRATDHSDFSVMHKPSAIQQYAVQIASGPAASDPDRYAGRLLATVLGDDSGSRFFWEFIDTGKAEYASLNAYEFQGTGVFMTFLCCTPDQIEDNLKAVREILDDVHQNGIREDELTRAKSKVCSHIVLQSERPANRLFAVGANWLQRHEYRTVRDVVEGYRAVTCDDITSLLQKYPLTCNTTVAIGPRSNIPSPI
ncbi:MAG: M16 family metallopeptidase [Pirellulaceae bacterium]